ncbi:MAG: sulfur carrier protein ThiS [bacterium]|nr:sulfur carrier protein ThiS [bacterium]
MSDPETISLTINGLGTKLPTGTTLLGFLESKKLPIPAIVVEYNKEILPKGQYDGITLADGDNLEIIQVIGGG